MKIFVINHTQIFVEVISVFFLDLDRRQTFVISTDKTFAVFDEKIICLFYHFWILYGNLKCLYFALSNEKQMSFKE